MILQSFLKIIKNLFCQKILKNCFAKKYWKKWFGKKFLEIKKLLPINFKKF